MLRLRGESSPVRLTALTGPILSHLVFNIHFRHPCMYVVLASSSPFDLQRFLHRCNTFPCPVTRRSQLNSSPQPAAIVPHSPPNGRRRWPRAPCHYLLLAAAHCMKLSHTPCLSSPRETWVSQ